MHSDTAIIIPTYNEEENIKNLSLKINKLLPKITIYIIDDSKNNHTKNQIPKKKNIIYLKRKNKSGRGSAVLDGLKKAIKLKRFKVFIEMDADFSHDPNELKKKIIYFKKNKLDLLISSRYLKKSKIINWDFSRKILSFFANVLAKLILKVPVTDYTNGFRFYSKSAAKTVISKCNKTGGGFIILSEIILILWKKNFKISEIKSIFKNRTRGESSVNLKLIIESLIGLCKLYLIKKSSKI